jgi:hypothetical protein
MVNIVELKGITTRHIEQLNAQGVHTTGQLLEVGATVAERMHLADTTHIDLELIEEYVHMADLFRIADISAAHVRQLYEVGVQSVPKLAYRRPVTLYEQLVAKSARYHPSLVQVERYVEHAKRHKKMLHH